MFFIFFFSKVSVIGRKVYCECDWCGKPISMKKYSFNRAKHHYCSVHCHAMHKTILDKGENNHQYGLRGPLNSSFKNQNLKTHNNHLIEDMIYVGEWYIGHVHGRVKMHRYLVEKNYYLYDESYFNVIDNWHYLKPKIEMHHIDFNHCNNDLSNLIPLSEGEHRSLHNKHRKQIRDSKTGKFKKSMKLNEYQQKALETAIYSKEFSIIYPALGMCGEAGEVADKVKKVIRDDNQEFTPEKKNEIAKEIGDVLWYCATLANDLGFTLEQIAEMNYEKLKSRQQRGKLNGSGDNR